MNGHSQDKKTNNYGYSLLELCRNFGIHICNGRLGTDAGVGRFTCDDAGVVDYVIASPAVLTSIRKFEVMDFDIKLSDEHSAAELELDVYFTIHVEPQENEGDENTTPTKESIARWNINNAETFRLNIDVGRIFSLKANLDSLLADESTNTTRDSVDLCVAEVTDIMLSSAKEWYDKTESSCQAQT